MHDMGKAVTGKQLLHAGLMGQIALDKVKTFLAGQLRQTCLFEAGIIIGSEIVKAHNPMPVFQQASGDMKADKARCTGDKNRILRCHFDKCLLIKGNLSL